MIYSLVALLGVLTQLCSVSFGAFTSRTILLVLIAGMIWECNRNLGDDGIGNDVAADKDTLEDQTLEFFCKKKKKRLRERRSRQNLTCSTSTSTSGTSTSDFISSMAIFIISPLAALLGVLIQLSSRSFGGLTSSGILLVLIAGIKFKRKVFSNTETNKQVGNCFLDSNRSL